MTLKWSNDYQAKKVDVLLGVNDGGAAVLHWSHAPDHEDTLGKPVERNPAGNEVYRSKISKKIQRLSAACLPCLPAKYSTTEKAANTTQ